MVPIFGCGLGLTLEILRIDVTAYPPVIRQLCGLIPRVKPLISLSGGAVYE